MLLTIALLSSSLVVSAETEELAPEPDPTPVTRYSTFDREADRAQALGESLYDDEVAVIGGGDDQHWRVYRTAASAPRGVVVLAAPASQPPDAVSVHTVRTRLPRSGWSTLTLALPAGPLPRLPERDRPVRGGGESIEEGTDLAESDAADQSSGDSEQEVSLGKQERAEPVTYDRDALTELNARLLSEHQGEVRTRLRDAVSDARNRAQGQVVVVMASGTAAESLAVTGADLGADALVLVDLAVDGPGQQALRDSLAELAIPALILQHAPKRWRPEHRLGPRVEMHLLPARSEVRLARRVSGYLRRNYAAK